MPKPEQANIIRTPIVLTISLASLVFLCFILFVAEEVGLDIAFGRWIMFLFLIGAYLLIAGITKTMSAQRWFTAKNLLIPAYNGMAIAAAILPSMVLVNLTAEIYQTGLGGYVVALALMAALIILASLLAPYYKNSGAYTPAEFVAAKSDSRLLQVLLVLTTLLVSGFLLLAQLLGLALIGQIGLGIDPNLVLAFSLSAVFIMVTLGGLRSLSIGRAFMFAIMVLGLFLPVIWLSQASTSNPIPQIAFGTGALQPLLETSKELLQNGQATLDFSKTIVDTSFLYDPSIWLIFICVACGTAAFPHVLQMFGGDKGTFSAKQSAAYGLSYVAIFLSLFPAMAFFIYWEILGEYSGQTLGEVAEQISWLFPDPIEGFSNHVAVCGSFVNSSEEFLKACGGGADQLFDAGQLQISPIYLVLKMADFVGLAEFFAIILAGGLMAAALSTIDGLLFSISTVLSHDLYYKCFRPTAPSATRLFWARAMLFAAVILFFWLTNFLLDQSGKELLDMIQILATISVSLSFAVLFPLMVMSIWWKKLSKAGAVLGCFFGLTLTSALIFFQTIGLDLLPYSGDEWSGVLLQSGQFIPLFEAGLAGFIITLVIAFGASMIWKISEKELARLEKLRTPSLKPLINQDLV